MIAMPTVILPTISTPSNFQGGHSLLSNISKGVPTDFFPALLTKAHFLIRVLHQV
jgi:hypothetical protein